MAQQIIKKIIATFIIGWLASFLVYSWPLLIISCLAGLVSVWTAWDKLNGYLAVGAVAILVILVAFFAGMTMTLFWPVLSLVIMLSINQAVITIIINRNES